MGGPEVRGQGEDWKGDLMSPGTVDTWWVCAPGGDSVTRSTWESAMLRNGRSLLY